MHGPARFVEFFHVLRSAAPRGARSISPSGIALMALIYGAEERRLAPRAIAEALGLSYTSAWNIADRLRLAGFVMRAGKGWALTDTGVRVMDVLAGVAAPAAEDESDELPYVD